MQCRFCSVSRRNVAWILHKSGIRMMPGSVALPVLQSVLYSSSILLCQTHRKVFLSQSSNICMSANRWRGFHPVGNRCLAKSLWPTQPTSVQRVVWCWQEDEEQASFKCVWTFILRNSCWVKHNSQNLSMDQFLYAIIMQWNVLEGIYVVVFFDSVVLKSACRTYNMALNKKLTSPS